MSVIGRRTLLKGTIAAGAASILAMPALGAQEGTVRIGFVGPLSGAQQIVGQPILIGAQVAVEQANAAGSDRTFELVLRDDKGDPSQTVANVRELVGSGTNFVVGAPLTATAVAVAGIAADLGIVYVAAGMGDERIAHELFSPNVFTALETNYARAHAFADVMARTRPATRVWVPIIPDISVGHASWLRAASGLKKYYGRAGIEVTLLEPVVAKYGSTDFKNQIVSLMSTEATGLYSVLFGQDGITFFTQALTFKLADKFDVIGEQALDIDLAKALGPRVPPNISSLSVWYPGAHHDNPESNALVEAFQARTGTVPPGLTAAGHTAVKAVVEGIAKAGSIAVDEVIDAMAGMEFDTVKGRNRIRKEDHQFVTSTDLINFAADDSQAGWSVAGYETTLTEPLLYEAAPGKPLEL